MSLTPSQLPLAERSPSEVLCEKCRGIPWDIFDTHKSIIGDFVFNHHRTFAELERSCDQGCPMCQNLRVMFIYDGVDFANDDPMHWRLSRFNFIEIGSEKYGYRKSRTYDLLEDSNIQPPGQRLPTVKRLAPDTIENDLDVLFENINQWLTACTTSGKHEECTSLESCTSSTSALPTRLIDVGTHDEDIIRLVESQTIYQRNEMKPLYLILSYRWGDGNRSARTTQNNFQQRKTQISIRELPRTIKDAIGITRRMKIRYLWVDAVCIIQPDNDRETEDWLKESANMCDYYSNACCCIAASSAEDSSEGILVERPVANYPFTEWSNPGGKLLGCPHNAQRLFRNPLLDRGWCLQEWILSPRILHWTRNGLIWECKKGFFWEGQKVSHDESLIPSSQGEGTIINSQCPFEMSFSPNTSTEIWQILDSSKDEALGYHWSRLIYCYNQMNLTNSRDRLAAIQGIATYLSNRHKVSYLAGIFEYNCMDGLLWKKDPQGGELTKIEDFPSWSWASAQGIFHIPFLDNQKSTSWMRCIRGFPSDNKIPNFTKRINRRIHITAPLISLPLEKIFDTPGWEGTLFGVYSDSPIWRGRCFSISLDHSKSDLVHLKGSFLLFVREDRESGTNIPWLEGLVVTRSFMDGDNVYQRIGVFSSRQEDVKEVLEFLDPCVLDNCITDVILV